MRDTSECLLQLRHLCCDIDMTLAAELQGVQKPGGPTDRHRAFQCRLRLVRCRQCRGAGAQQARFVVRF